MNRLTPEEQELLRAARKWFNHRDIANARCLRQAVGAWIRSEQAREDDGKSLAG